MQESTITAALLALRVRLIREHGDRLEHVEALLAPWRVPMPPVARAPRQAFKPRELRREIVALLREGPKPSSEIADRVQEAHGFTRRRARECVKITPGKMQRAGWVTRTQSLWDYLLLTRH